MCKNVMDYPDIRIFPCRYYTFVQGVGGERKCCKNVISGTLVTSEFLWDLDIVYIQGFILQFGNHYQIQNATHHNTYPKSFINDSRITVTNNKNYRKAYIPLVRIYVYANTHNNQTISFYFCLIYYAPHRQRTRWVQTLMSQARAHNVRCY